METENYVYKKEVDWSVLMEGFTLPIENQVVFLQNMGRFLQRGESKIIHFYMEGKTYDVKLSTLIFRLKNEKKMHTKLDMLEMESFHRLYRSVLNRAWII